MMQAIITVPLPFADIVFLFVSNDKENDPQHQTTEMERSSTGTIAQEQLSIHQWNEASMPGRFADPANRIGDVGHVEVFL